RVMVGCLLVGRHTFRPRRPTRSLIASPSKLRQITVTNRDRPGKVIVHHESRKYVRAPAIMAPHSAVGSGEPRPTNPRVEINRIVEPTSPVARAFSTHHVWGST